MLKAKRWLKAAVSWLAASLFISIFLPGLWNGVNILGIHSFVSSLGLGLVLTSTFSILLQGYLLYMCTRVIFTLFLSLLGLLGKAIGGIAQWFCVALGLLLGIYLPIFIFSSPFVAFILPITAYVITSFMESSAEGLFQLPTHVREMLSQPLDLRFTYNRFWHRWYTLDNRYYFRFILTYPLVISSNLASLFFPATLSSLGAFLSFAAIPCGIGALALFIGTQISNVLWKQQNHALERLAAAHPGNAPLLEQINWYRNARVVCPESLLQGNLIQWSRPENKGTAMQKTTSAQPLFNNQPLAVTSIVAEQKEATSRNQAYTMTTKQSALFAKEVKPLDGAYEIAAREMAVAMGPEFAACIPENALFISTKMLTTPADTRTLAPIDKQTALQLNQPVLYVQQRITNATNGQQLWKNLLAGILNFPPILAQLSQESFEKNFLLQLVLGPFDGNPGNTLITPEGNFYSIDHERIMPENNYNIVKSLGTCNDFQNSQTLETPCPDVFPIRLWLAGLPLAKVPFSQKTMQMVLDTLDPENLLQYHRQNPGLFSPGAIRTQLERVEMIRTSFRRALNDPQAVRSCTPRALFLQLVNNHPTHAYLTEELEWDELSAAAFLGNFSENSRWNEWEHPLQSIGHYGATADALCCAKMGATLSETLFHSKTGTYFIFYNSIRGMNMELAAAPKMETIFDTESARRLAEREQAGYQRATV